ncbi:MAG: hypothetical protein IPM64_10900 [Phycisphaerales bacterium]|nr:hypothetical protein [Phycisphaerales bacterium]
MSKTTTDELLSLLGGKSAPTADQFKELILQLDTHQILAKVFLLEGTPYVFENSPMRYIVFKEQVADRFDIGSQDVCIVGSAKLGFSPSPHQYGKPFAETSDVDVVIISNSLFDLGSRELFAWLDQQGPALHLVRPHLTKQAAKKQDAPVVELSVWKLVKEAIRNYKYQNFNPGLLPGSHPLRRDFFEKIASTAGIFLALEPRVFVSKIRGRVFRTWRAAEDYYTNTLRQVKEAEAGHEDVDTDEDDGEDIQATTPQAKKA